jgi:uncharacterized membrane protein
MKVKFGMERIMRNERLVVNASVVAAMIGFLAAYAADTPASAAVHGPKCAAHQSRLNGECVDDAFINPDSNPCGKGAACYRRGGHKSKARRPNN